MINPNIIPKINISRIDNSSRVKENLFDIKRKFLLKNIIISFSLDRLGGIDMFS